MDAIKKKARELLESGAVKVVIGYVQGSEPERVRALFARTPEQTDRLIVDPNAHQNLVIYLFKPEIKSLGKPAIVATTPMLRAILQLAKENQVTDGQFVALVASDNGTAVELSSLKEIEAHLAGTSRDLTAEEKSQIERYDKMSREERWAFWREQFARCLRCYACRAACPLCYCGRCAVECNQPQWISAAPHERANIEWHLTRAMHLAGRCINCGFCATACPVGIPLNLLTQVLNQEVSADFGLSPGSGVSADYVLSSFKPEDKEDFIR